MSRVRNFPTIPYSEAERMHRDGRMTDREWQRYERVWTWSAVRFGGSHGMLHDRFYNLRGHDAYYARINRVRRASGWEPLANIGEKCR